MVKSFKRNDDRVKKRRSTQSRQLPFTKEQKKQFDALQTRLGITFKNVQVMIHAFTHSSYVNEHRKKSYEDNERLEFLGDSVLELTVSEFLFKTYPKMSEGDLTKLRAAIVCEPALVQFAQELNFDKLILLGKGEELTGGRQRPALLADVFEAFVGALYLDQGLRVVVQFLRENIFPKVDKGAFSHVMDYKSQLQELIQRHSIGGIEYRITDEKGPAHNREFVSSVYLNGRVIGEGIGKSKKEAEQAAAYKGLLYLQDSEVDLSN